MRVNLDYDTVHSTQFKVRHYWDGWNLIFIKYVPTAYISKNAVYRNGAWYLVLDTVRPNRHGVWRVKENYVK